MLARRIALRSFLTFAFLAVLLPIVLTSGSLFYRSARYAMEEFALQLADEVSSRVREKVVSFFDVPQRVVAFNVEQARAGARSVHYTVLRLPWEVAPLFKQWLAEHAPDKADRILARVRELHGVADAPAGTVYRAVFRDRMKGRGVWADLIRQRVRQAAARHGLGHASEPLDVSAFRPPARPLPRPHDDAQASLF